MTTPPVSPADGPAAVAPSGPAQSGIADINGTHLAWTRSGPRSTTRPSLLLTHGLTDSADTWNRITQHLARTHDVVCFDARGHGASDRSSDYSAEAHTRDLIGIAEALQLDRPVIIGHSMGGLHATLAAAQIPVRALVLEDPAWPQVPQDGTKDIADSRRRVAEVAALPDADRLAIGHARYPLWNTIDVQAWSAAHTRLDPDVVDWFKSWRTRNAWREHIAALHVPGLLLIGDADPATVAVLPTMATEAQQFWSQLQGRQVTGATHNIRRDQFTSFLQTVTAFLDDLE